MKTPSRLSLIVAGAWWCGACAEPPSVSTAAAAEAPDAVPVAATTTAPVDHGALSDPAFWTPAGASTPLVLGAAEISGLVVYDAAGARTVAATTLEPSHVSVLPVPGAEPAPSLVVIADAATSTIGAYALDARTGALTARMAEAIGVDDEVTGLCTFTGNLAGNAYVYAVTDGGLLHHYELYASGEDVAARRLRTVPVGKGSGFCSVDPRDGTLYLSQEHTGVWRLPAEAETDTALEPVDLREPFGALSDDVKGVAVYPVDGERSYLLVADVGRQQVAVYALPDGARLGAVRPEGLEEPEGLAIDAATGLVAIADEATDDGGSSLKLMDWRAVAGALNLETAASPAVRPERPPVVRAVVETEPLASRGDAADDPAIWIHPVDPAASRVIGTDKQSGLHVYDLAGHVQQYLPDGRMNNVDLRDGFPLGGAAVALVTASNRSNDSIAVYAMDPASSTLRDVAAGVLDTGFSDPYGLCMYRSAGSGEFYVFVNDGGSGTFRQWRLFDDGGGRVASELVREFAVGSQAEGCVADDATGRLYVAEEDVGLWRYAAEPDGGSERTAIDATGDAGRLTDDVEGVDLWLGPDGSGYLIASNQGANNYAVYRRDGDNAFVGMFHIVASPADGIDGASETDGLAVTSAALGGAFDEGLLVVQDGRNLAPEEGQNFKYVAWRDVIAALQPARP